jgi:hypothetical protein
MKKGQMPEEFGSFYPQLLVWTLIISSGYFLDEIGILIDFNSND